MSLTHYFRIFRQWWWVLVLMGGLTAASALVFSKIQTKEYKSTILLSVTPTRPDLGLTESAKNLLRNYVLVIQSKTFAQKVIDQLQLDDTAENLLGHVTIASDDSRFAIQLDFKSENAEEANLVAKEWATQFVKWRETQNAQVRREDQVLAALVDEPQLTVNKPKTTVNTLAGGILGVLLGGVIIFVLEYREASVLRSVADLELGLGLSVLGVIPATAASRKKG